ncbi:MAG TPA: hypothetical protein PKJ62_03270 [Bacteroidia bacterium]|nr:hypothetical protein [Bacteroidia bacterium]HNS12518.1 hypothetical protein [Bacteroidia bacterium]
MQNRNFQTLLGKYFAGGWFTITDGLLSALFPSFILDKNASRIIEAYESGKIIEGNEPVQTLTIPAYDGNNQDVRTMMESLKEMEDDIYAAFVHGSIATNEEINFSDFDGLIIIRNEVFGDKNRLKLLAGKINKTRAIMHRIDPLQHHGWFILAERDLLDYPVGYLPPEVLAYSKSLLPASDFELSFVVRTKADYFGPVKNICRRIRKISKVSNRPKTLYQLKSVLSEFMMLPTLYIQARDQRGIFKKFSFTAAAADFNQNTWSIMEDVSRIRQEWPKFENQAELRKFRKIGYIWMKYRKKMGPPIPGQFVARLNDDFYNRMAELANQVEVNLFR